jgi:hypothetical protein
MTFSQYINFIYTSNIEPRNRKTNNQIHTSWGYPELKRLYMNYYLMTEPESHRLTIKKIEPFLELMEVNFQDYLYQLLPATTILECQGTTYRNTVFHRQRFVYKEGINDGSEFQNSLPPDLRPPLTPVQIKPKINDYFGAGLNSVVIKSDVSQGINKRISAVKIAGYIDVNNIKTKIKVWEISGEIQLGTSQTTIVP